MLCWPASGVCVAKLGVGGVRRGAGLIGAGAWGGSVRGCRGEILRYNTALDTDAVGVDVAEA